MTEAKQGTRTAALSRFRTMVLILLAGIFTFGGPYLSYLLIHLETNYILSMISGFATFIIGLTLIWYVVTRKIIS